MADSVRREYDLERLEVLRQAATPGAPDFNRVAIEAYRSALWDMSPGIVTALREAEARLDSQWDDHDCGQTAADNLERAFEAEQRAERAGKLLERVLMLRMHGEDAPGGTDTWYQLDGDVETYLRSVLDSKGEPTT